MNLKKSVELVVSVQEILTWLRSVSPSSVVIPEKVSVVPLHGKEQQAGHAGEFSAVRLSWEEKGA